MLIKQWPEWVGRTRMRIHQTILEQQNLQMFRSQNPAAQTQQLRPQLLEDSFSFTHILEDEDEAEIKAINKDDDPQRRNKRNTRDHPEDSSADPPTGSSEFTSADETSNKAETTGHLINLTA